MLFHRFELRFQFQHSVGRIQWCSNTNASRHCAHFPCAPSMVSTCLAHTLDSWHGENVRWPHRGTCSAAVQSVSHIAFAPQPSSLSLFGETQFYTWRWRGGRSFLDVAHQVGVSLPLIGWPLRFCNVRCSRSGGTRQSYSALISESSTVTWRLGGVRKPLPAQYATRAGCKEGWWHLSLRCHPP